MKIIKIELTANELALMCRHLVAAIASETPGGLSGSHEPSIALKEWQRHRSAFVDRHLKNETETSREFAENLKHSLEEDAALLEKLYPLLPAAPEVTRV